MTALVACGGGGGSSSGTDNDEDSENTVPTDSDAATGSDTITVSVKAWTHPADLSDNISSDERDFYCPRVAMDSNGNAIITWAQSNGTRYQVFKSEYYYPNV